MGLYWDTTYATAIALIERYPEIDPIEVGLLELANLVESLPDFKDDAELVTERILKDIQITWYEEISSS